jgi:hemolysin activation/secretion protein
MGGVQYNNLWGMDHIVNLSYTLPPDHADTIKQYGGSYALPLYPLHGWLNMSYTSSSTNNGVVANDLSITGAGEMIGIHYQQFLPKLGKYEHNLDVGLDSKHFINDVQFKKVQLSSNVRSSPFSISYKAEYPFEGLKAGYFSQWAMNTGLLSDNTDVLYDKARKGANSSWNLFRYGANIISSYQDWTLSTSILGQYSEKPLIAGEQIGIGGSFDIRGYEQRETSADNGQITKIELTSPAWEKMNAFVFYDYGHGEGSSTMVRKWNLSGTGVGAKVAWRENLNASLAFATALNDNPTTPNGTKAFNNRLLLNVTLRY